jgi:hypothetical protein
MQERFFGPGMDIGVGVSLLTGEALAVAFEPSSRIFWAMRSASVMSRSVRSASATGYPGNAPLAPAKPSTQLLNLRVPPSRTSAAAVPEAAVPEN